MKNLFILLNIVLFFCVVVLGVVFFTHKVRPPEKVLQNSPDKANSVAYELFDLDKKFITSSAISLVSDNNLFSPTRGVVDLPPEKKPLPIPKKANFELIGLCTMGVLKGAIIINKGKRSKKKNFYLVGSIINGTAYKLIDINPHGESAIIGVGNSRFEIKLERGDSGSLNRRKEGEARSKALVSLSQLKPKVVQPKKRDDNKRAIIGDKKKGPKKVLSPRQARLAKRRAFYDKMKKKSIDAKK